MKSRRFIALPFDALNHRVFAFASSAKRPNVSFGSDLDEGNQNVRSTLRSRHRQAAPLCPFRAMNGLMHRSNSSVAGSPEVESFRGPFVSRLGAIRPFENGFVMRATRRARP